MRTIIKPYEGILDTYLDATGADESKNRKDFLDLFVNDEVPVYNDIPTCPECELNLKVNQYCGLTKAFGNGKQTLVELNQEEIYLCRLRDTILFVKKVFAIDSIKSESYLKIKVRYFPTGSGGEYKILYIQKSTKPLDTDRDKVPDDCDKCVFVKGDENLSGCPDKDGDGIDDKDDKCLDEKGTYACQGCPDRDEDGVTDKEDLCPETKGLAIYSGCPFEKDSDGDGVPDTKDNCPNTAGDPKNSGCPIKAEIAGEKDSDNDGVTDKKDNCPFVAGEISNFGCPVTRPIAKPDSDKDGLPDAEDSCPYEYARTSNGCPQTYQRSSSPEEKKVHFGVALSGGFNFARLSGGDTDILDSFGWGFSPSLLMSIKLSENTALQFDVNYSKKGFEFFNYGDNTEYGYTDPLYYYTENAVLNFHEYGVAAKLSYRNFFVGGYYNRVFAAKRSGGVFAVDQFGSVFIDRTDFKYNFLNENDYGVMSGQSPINKNAYGLSFGYEGFSDELLLGIGYDLNLSNYFNNNYPLWDDSYNIDFYDPHEIAIRLDYLYFKIGYIFQ